MKITTNDKAPSPNQPLLSNERIGANQSWTREGFLLCRDVPFARVGWMIYGPNETPVETSDNGYAMVHRGPEDLFHPDTMRSFEGKSITNEHADGGVVTVKNWRDEEVGTAHNIRRGEGEDSDVLFCDMLIKEPNAIRDVRMGKREVSAGYEADYEQTGPGEGRQLNIIGNHIALVNRGRCGPRCAIGDQAHSLNPQPKDGTMPATTTRRPQPGQAVLDAMRQKLLDAAVEGMTSLTEGGDPPPGSDMSAAGTGTTDEGHVHIHMHTAAPFGETEDAPPGDDEKDPMGHEARFASLENGHKEILEQIAHLTSLIAGKKEEPAAPTGDNKDGGADEPGPYKEKAEDSGAPFGEAEEGEDKGKTKDAKPKEGEAEEEDANTSGEFGSTTPHVKTGDGAVTEDSAALGTSWRTLVADAEVLVPGFRVPAFIPTAKRVHTIDAMCSTRRKALDVMNATAEGKAALDSVLEPGVALDKMACDQVAVLFKAAAAVKRASNNRKATGDSGHVPPKPNKPQGPQTLADLNQIHAKMRETTPVTH